MGETTVVLVLAAGNSSRMGKPKQLLPWKDTTLIGHAVRVALKVPGSKVFVVVGAYRQAVSSELKGLPVTLIEHPDFQRGLGTSLARGVQHFINQDSHSAENLVVTLADQPSVSAHYLSRLLDRSCALDAIIATRYPKGAGVPAVFPRRYFNQLANLGGDAGAKQLLNASTSDVYLIEPPFDLFDIDTPEDYQRHEGDQERH